MWEALLRCVMACLGGHLLSELAWSEALSDAVKVIIVVSLHRRCCCCCLLALLGVLLLCCGWLYLGRL